MKKQLLTLSDQVRVESTEGYTISSSLLHYDDRQKEITTEENVRITTDDMVIKGTGLRYNMETGAYRVDGRVDFQVK
jgi:LPS export ABC transporter protein LptC